MFKYDTRFFPDPETEEIIESRVILSGDKCTFCVEAAEPVRVVVFRARSVSKTKVRLIDCVVGFKK